MRSYLIPLLVALGLMTAVGLADESKAPRAEAAVKSNRAEKTKSSLSQAEREKLALRFVKEHHPELTSLLEQLKAMRSEEYNRAIGELFQVSQSLEALKKNNPRQYEVGLEFWKAKSKAELLAAQADQLAVPRVGEPVAARAREPTRPRDPQAGAPGRAAQGSPEPG